VQCLVTAVTLKMHSSGKRWLRHAPQHADLGPASLVLLRRIHPVLRDRRWRRVPRAGFSKVSRLDPQITIGLLTGAAGFPLMARAFEGNKAETKTMLPVIKSFMTAHQLKDVTVVPDAGMISDANQRAIENAGLSFILRTRITEVPHVVDQWRRDLWVPRTLSPA
jgi:hypothetical protein